MTKPNQTMDLSTYVAFLRGINVGGKNIIGMQSLREKMDIGGFLNVRTYIQSGNIIFDHSEKNLSREVISNLIKENFGMEVPVILLKKEEFIKIAEKNFFLQEKHENISSLYVTFLSEIPQIDNIKVLSEVNFLPDEFLFEEKAVYLCCRNGYSNTKLNITMIEKKLKVFSTTRNWNTIIEISKII